MVHISINYLENLICNYTPLSILVMEGQGMGMQFGREEMQRGGRGGRELGGGGKGRQNGEIWT